MLGACHKTPTAYTVQKRTALPPNKKNENLSILAFSNPSWARLRYFQQAVVCSFSLHPPNFHGRKSITWFSPEGIKQKIRWKTIGPFVVPPQVGRSPRSDGNVCGILHIHYRRSSSVSSTVLTLNNLRVFMIKINPSTSLFSATKVQLLFYSNKASMSIFAII